MKTEPVTAHKAAKLLGITEYYFQKAVEAGKITPSKNIIGKLRFEVKQLKELKKTLGK